MTKTFLLFICFSFSIAVFAAPSEEEKAKFTDFLKVKRLDKVEEINRQQLRKNFFAREQLANTIAGQGLLDEALVEAEVREFEKDVLIHRYFQAFLDTAVTKQMVKEYYQDNKSDYKYKKINVAHILFRVTDTATAAQDTEVKSQAQSVLEQLSEDGSNFAQMAHTHSKDSRTKLKGGNLGWVKQGVVDEAFSKKLFKLTTESGPTLIKSSWGYHIVLVRENAEKVVQTFSEVSGKIRSQLRQQAKKSEKQRLKSL